VGGVFVDIIVFLLQHGCEESGWTLRRCRIVHMHNASGSLRERSLLDMNTLMYWVNEMKVLRVMKNGVLVTLYCCIRSRVTRELWTASPINSVQGTKRPTSQYHKQKNGIRGYLSSPQFRSYAPTSMTSFQDLSVRWRSEAGSSFRLCFTSIAPPDP
jgi:hypothetical protein